jgi:hypothetical protein
MDSRFYLGLTVLSILLIGNAYYLLRSFMLRRQLIALAGLLLSALAMFLLILDLLLITLTHGPQYIPDYLLFNRLVSDTGFAGRWVLTVYVFFTGSVAVTIYLLARNIVTKFNKSKTK